MTIRGEAIFTCAETRAAQRLAILNPLPISTSQLYTHAVVVVRR